MSDIEWSDRLGAAFSTSAAQEPPRWTRTYGDWRTDWPVRESGSEWESHSLTELLPEWGAGDEWTESAYRAWARALLEKEEDR